nr:MBL fold metallo-hydrolase [endosymbiont of unidentified scaly snail isolate Monju]
MNNPSFLVTEQGVVVVDPGGTLQAGRMLVGKIRATTDKPVLAVFNTHVHGDHWLGNQAIVEAWPQAVIYAHPKMIEEAKAGCMGLVM